jgi:hypothetical protein
MKTADLYILHERFWEFSASCMYENARRFPVATVGRIGFAGFSLVPGMRAHGRFCDLGKADLTA